MRWPFRSDDRLLSSLRRFHAAFCQLFPALERGGGLRNPQCAVAFRSTYTISYPMCQCRADRTFGGLWPRADIVGEARVSDYYSHYCHPIRGRHEAAKLHLAPADGTCDQSALGRDRACAVPVLVSLQILVERSPFRQQYQRGYKKSKSTKKAKPEKASKTHQRTPQKTAAKGPLLIIISIADQRISLYDDGALVARSSVSTGVKGHPTPLGVFSVISKNKWHRSNIYSGAPMPYMQRITWSGIALHAGDLPGYPASHGCIRLTHDFAVRLWHLTKRGTRVIIAHDDIRPAEISNPQLFVPKPKVALATPQLGTTTQPVSDTSQPMQRLRRWSRMRKNKRMLKRMPRLLTSLPREPRRKRAHQSQSL